MRITKQHIITGISAAFLLAATAYMFLRAIEREAVFQAKLIEHRCATQDMPEGYCNKYNLNLARGK